MKTVSKPGGEKEVTLPNGIIVKEYSDGTVEKMCPEGCSDGGTFYNV